MSSNDSISVNKNYFDTNKYYIGIGILLILALLYSFYPKIKNIYNENKEKYFTKIVKENSDSEQKNNTTEESVKSSTTS
jgi:hypothetical protein